MRQASKVEPTRSDGIGTDHSRETGFAEVWAEVWYWTAPRFRIAISTILRACQRRRQKKSMVRFCPKFVSTTGAGSTITGGFFQTAMYMKDKRMVCLSYRSDFEVIRNYC